MRIDWAIACRYLELHEGLATIVGAGIDQLTVPALGTEVSVMIALRLTVTPGDEGDHPVTVSIADPELELVGRLDGQFHTEGQPHQLPGWEGHHIVPLTATFTTMRAGAHTITIAIGSSSVDVPMIIHTADG